ncbi:MAG: RluA family pseudouridine synthase [Treponema sp.]|jgi:23S rRNA pseudouridine1911/1915/1917 synthase|nr:RluA family pseudouridine synthase [Treponema sp.]
MQTHSCVAAKGGLRLDRYIACEAGLLSRSQIKARSLKALVNGIPQKISHIVKKGDLLDLSWDDAPPLDLIPQDIPLRVLYEDDRVIVVDKAQGMVVHPGAGNREGTLANALLFRALRRGASAPGPAARPCIVHRLDKDTSGVLIACWDEAALECLAAQFRARTVRKTYAALVAGTPGDASGVIDARIARDKRSRTRFMVSTAPEKGRAALTRYRVARSWGTHSLLLLRPRTGRTHQLRVHLLSIGHPIIGDPIYRGPGPSFPNATLMLHALRLGITLPGADAQSVFRAPLPARFRAYWINA